MKSARDILISEALALPVEVKDRMVKDVQISFHFADGKMHHVKPVKHISLKLARDCLKRQIIKLKNWKFLDSRDVEV